MSNRCDECRRNGPPLSGECPLCGASRPDVKSYVELAIEVREIGEKVDVRGENMPLVQDLGDWEEEKDNRVGCVLCSKMCGFWIVFSIPSLFVGICAFTTWSIIVALSVFLPISIISFIWAMAWYRRVWLSGGIPSISEERDHSCCGSNKYMYYQKPCCPTLCKWFRCSNYFSFVEIRRVAGYSPCENIRAITFLCINLFVFAACSVMWMSFTVSQPTTTT